jgi:hypothetical protein
MMQPLYHIGNRLFRGVALNLTVDAGRQNFTLLGPTHQPLATAPEATIQDVHTVRDAYTVVVSTSNVVTEFGNATVQRFLRWGLTPIASGLLTPTLISDTWFAPQQFAVLGQGVGLALPTGRVIGLFPGEILGRSFDTVNQFRSGAHATLPGTIPTLPA